MLALIDAGPRPSTPSRPIFAATGSAARGAGLFRGAGKSAPPGWRGASCAGPASRDGAGVVRPGWLVATAPRALVTAPRAGTVRYAGPLLDYGNVIILEPENDYLLVLTGLGTLFAERGEVVGTGAALGLMPGEEQASGRYSCRNRGKAVVNRPAKRSILR